MVSMVGVGDFLLVGMLYGLVSGWLVEWVLC